MRRKSLAIWLALLVICGLIAGRTSYRTDMGDFLPHSASLAQQVLAGQVNGGAASHIVLLAIKGGPVMTPAVSLYQFLGYCLLVICSLLALRALAAVFTAGAGRRE